MSIRIHGSQPANRRLKLGATMVATATAFGAAFSTLFVDHQLQADIVDLTYDGGQGFVELPCTMSGTFFRVDIDQIPNVATSADFRQWNEAIQGTGRTMAIQSNGMSANILSIRANGIESGDIIDPATFMGVDRIGGSMGTPNNTNTFDGSGTAFVGFRTAAGNVGWWKVTFLSGNPSPGNVVIHSSGFLGTNGEPVLVIDGACCDCSYKFGDLNGDGIVDLLDVQPFVDSLLSGTYQCQGDVNEDGNLDLLDVPLFVDILLGG